MDSEFSTTLIGWYKLNKRDLPWRKIQDPYRIWISEIILQQTQVKQGLPYFERILEKYPNIEEFALAPLEDILRLWQGLGYYSRARNMHEAALQVIKDFDGVFPNSFIALKKLKGIGSYTAAAIASFAFGEVVPVVDGNVFRLLSRYTGNSTPINTLAGKRVFEEMASSLISFTSPAEFNQAIMEFGSLQCRPKLPLCVSCILNTGCFAFKESKQNVLPVKLKSQPPRVRYFNYLKNVQPDTFYLNKRTRKDIWEGLYDFPLFETALELNIEEFCSHEGLSKLCGGKTVVFHEVIRLPKHILSHQIIHASIWKINVEDELIPGSPSSFIVEEEDLNKYALPRLITRYLEKK